MDVRGRGTRGAPAGEQLLAVRRGEGAEVGEEGGAETGGDGAVGEGVEGGEDSAVDG